MFISIEWLCHLSVTGRFYIHFRWCTKDIAPDVGVEFHGISTSGWYGLEDSFTETTATAPLWCLCDPQCCDSPQHQQMPRVQKGWAPQPITIEQGDDIYIYRNCMDLLKFQGCNPCVSKLYEWPSNAFKLISVLLKWTKNLGGIWVCRFSPKFLKHTRHEGGPPPSLHLVSCFIRPLAWMVDRYSKSSIDFFLQLHWLSWLIKKIWSCYQRKRTNGIKIHIIVYITFILATVGFITQSSHGWFNYLIWIGVNSQHQSGSEICIKIER